MRPRGSGPASPYAFLALSDATVGATPFGARSGRAGGALGTAVAVHAVIGLAFWGVARLQPPTQPSVGQASPTSIARFIFTAPAGDGSGRSSGGDRSTAPVARLRTVGADMRSVPTAAPRSLATPETIAPEVESTPAVPVQPMRAGELPQIGAVDGVPGLPSIARGPGEGGIGTQTGSDRGLGERSGPGVGDGPYGVGNGVSGPELILRTPPRYTADAMRAKLQGVVLLTGVVGVDGALHDVRIARSLDAAFGLDQEAIACVRQWRFRPGMRLGKPVAVAVTIEVAFNLR